MILDSFKAIYNVFDHTQTLGSQNFLVTIVEPIQRQLLLEDCEYFWLLPKSWQVVTCSSNSLSIWSLPRSVHEDCMLLLHWAKEWQWDDYSWAEELGGVFLMACENEKSFTLGIHYTATTVSARNLYVKDNATYFSEGVKNLRTLLKEEKDANYRSLATKYLGVHINSSFGDSSQSVISILCGLICELPVSKELAKVYRTRTTAILTSSDVQWKPRPRYSSGNNPISILLEGAHTKPPVMEVAEAVIDWCTGKARDRGQPEYLYFVLECMPELVGSHPSLASKVAQQFAHFVLQDHDRQLIINNHAVVTALSVSQLRNSQNMPIYHCRNPILQLRLNLEPPEPKNAYFTEDIFVASFNLLWSIERPPEDSSLEYVQTNLPSTARWKVF